MPDVIRVGLVGAGLAASFHLAAYQRVSSVPMELAGIVSRTPGKARALADRHGIRCVYPDLAAMLRDPRVDVVDLCVPVHLHHPMALAAARAGKHVICEKPLHGYAGDGRTGATPREAMFAAVQAELEDLAGAFRRSGRKLLYAENWVYAPAFRRMVELVRASGGTILDIRGNESHSGSTSDFSKEWATSGGGALLRLGIHPLSAAIYLKQLEGRLADGVPHRVREVVGHTADLSKVPGFERPDTRLVSGWKDVENWAHGILTFDDGSTAVISCSDTSLGGIDSSMDVFTTNARFRCNLHPNDTCVAYAPDPAALGSVFLSEKLETSAGWSFPTVDHEWESGYAQEIQDFVEAVYEDREPLSGLELAVESIRVAYALYWSAEAGQRIRLPN